MVVVHNTDLQTYKRCRTLWDFSSPLRRNLEPDYPVPPLEFGTIWHSALEAYYTTDSAQAHDAIESGFDAWEPDGPEAEEEVERLRILCHGMLTHYEAWAPTVDEFEVVWCERAYEVPLYEGVSYGFKPDALVKDHDGNLWIMEHKSAERLPGDNKDYLLTDDQVGRYLWGLREAEGVKIEGVLYNVARKAAPGPLKENKNGDLSIDKRQPTTYEIAATQLKEKYPSRIPVRYHEYLDFLQQRGSRDYFFREPVRRSAIELERIGLSLRAEAHEMLSDPYIHRTPSAYNCNYCSFVGPCILKWSGQDYEMSLKGN